MVGCGCPTRSVAGSKRDSHSTFHPHTGICILHVGIIPCLFLKCSHYWGEARQPSNGTKVKWLEVITAPGRHWGILSLLAQSSLGSLLLQGHGERVRGAETGLTLISICSSISLFLMAAYSFSSLYRHKPGWVGSDAPALPC